MSDEVPEPPEVSVPVVAPGLPEPVAPVEEVWLLPDSEEPKMELPPKELPPVFEVPANPPPLGPMPARVEALPARGWPKKPMAVGVLLWPNRMGFQSSWPVMGSL